MTNVRYFGVRSATSRDGNQNGVPADQMKDKERLWHFDRLFQDRLAAKRRRIRLYYPQASTGLICKSTAGRRELSTPSQCIEILEGCLSSNPWISGSRHANLCWLRHGKSL
ncbi:hypothetical protein N7G274_008892 [Stereocaulon virgatum]|uniref:Uncharacterized protein n=1 Tax=Stereocaulon virgatum TaxID=373712 RepID=A0ABR4A4G7_9LECA